MQVILGSNGSIGKLLAKELTNYTSEIRLVSRTPVKINPSDQVFAADLLNRQIVFEAVKGADVVYLLAGLKYSTKIWQTEWVPIMQNVINACKKESAKLVFMDNIYMIDKSHLRNITEESPINPSSKKGEVRAELDKMILSEIENGSLNAIIARSADFFGPTNPKLSVLFEVVISRMLAGKSPQWFVSTKKYHSFTYTPDIARSLAILGNTDDAFNQIWNLPTSDEKLTGDDIIAILNRKLNKNYKPQVMSKGLNNFLGLFVPILKEMSEMAYQWELDYHLNSTKFNNRFNYKPVTFAEGLEYYFR